jgi:hypothetical protein
MTAQRPLDGHKEQKMLRLNNIIEHLFVKISAPFRLDVCQRKVFVNSTFVSVATPAGRQDGDYQYCASVTSMRENNAVYTTAPIWASVDEERAVAARPGRRDA